MPNASQPNDSTLQRNNRGNSNFDVRNRLTWNFIYEFPNRNGDWRRLTDGWGVNGIVTAQSGQPFHMIYSNAGQDFDGAGTFFPVPDVVGPIKFNYSDPNNFLDMSSFTVPCTPGPGFDGSAATCVPGTRHFGNLGRNSLLGPNFRQFDFSIFKITSITERVKLELRFEAYNVLNHPNFASPLWPNFLSDATPNGISSGGAGACGGLAAGRSCGFQPLTVTADVGIGYPFLGGGGPRSMQVAAKITF